MNITEYSYIPPNVSHAECCRGDDVKHETISAIPNAFEDKHACIDCCPCPDCGEYRAEHFSRDPSGWEMVGENERNTFWKVAGPNLLSERIAIKMFEKASADLSTACDALEVAINTVECDSLDKNGNDLPWYTGAKNALAGAGHPYTGIRQVKG